MTVTKIDGGRQIKSGTVTNSEIASSAAIATSKLADGTKFIQKDGSVAYTADQSLGGFKVTNLGTPSSASDAATKSYVDGAVFGLDWKASVRVATTTSATLATAYENGDTVDGVTLATGDRILIKNQISGQENGIYVVQASGSPARAADADGTGEVTAGTTVFVSEGTTNGNTAWTLTTDDPITLGTTVLTFAQISGASYSAGAGLTLTGNVIDVVAADTSITVNTDNIQVNAGDASLEVSSGLRVKHGTGGQVYLSNSSGVCTPTTLSGDVSSVSNTGSVTLDSGIQRTSKFVDRETPSGSMNGSNTSFTLSQTPVTGSEHLFLNGLLQEPGAGNDYTISGTTITMLSAPLSGDRLKCSYRAS